MNELHYVYIYLDPRVKGLFQYGQFTFYFQPFYVGKGIRDRCFHHLRRSSKNPYKLRKIQKIREAGLQPIIIFVESDLLDATALHIEKMLIKMVGRGKHGPLTNLTDGGDIPPSRKGAKHSQATKRLMSLKKTGIPLPYSANRGRNISAALTGRKFSIEHRHNLSKARKKRQITLVTRQRVSASMMGKSTRRYRLVSPEGIEYTTSKGLSDFCREFNLSMSSLMKVLSGKRVDYKGWQIERLANHK